MENAMLAMTCMGLGGFYAGFVSIASQDKRLLRLLKIPPENELFGALTIGYPKIHLTRWAERKKPQITWA
jgi:nitroreductase